MEVGRCIGEVETEEVVVLDEVFCDCMFAGADSWGFVSAPDMAVVHMRHRLPQMPISMSYDLID